MDAAAAKAAAAVNDPSLTPVQRQAAVQTAATLTALKPSQQNLDAVKPFTAQLAPLMK